MYAQIIPKLFINWNIIKIMIDCIVNLNDV